MKSNNFLNSIQPFLILGLLLTLFVSIQKTSNSHTIEMQNMRFVPDKITLKKGDSIKFINKSNMIHNIVIQDLGINSKFLKKDDSVIIQITKEGKFDFYCMPHRNMGMKGVIAVEGKE